MCIKKTTFFGKEEQRENYFKDIRIFYKAITIKIVWN